MTFMTHVAAADPCGALGLRLPLRSVGTPGADAAKGAKAKPGGKEDAAAAVGSVGAVCTLALGYAEQLLGTMAPDGVPAEEMVCVRRRLCRPPPPPL